MKIKVNCENPKCLAKRSMLPIFTIEYYAKKHKVKNFNLETTRTYRTHADKTAFYICKKCASMSNFRLEQIQRCGVFWIFLVEKKDVKSLRELEGKKKPSCIYCEQHTDSPRPSKKEITKPSVTRLYLNPNREYIGYFCSVCRRVYAIKLNRIDWKNADINYTKAETVNVLGPLNSFLPSKEKEKHPRFDKDKGLVTRYLEFKAVGGYVPYTPIKETDPRQLVSMYMPRNKIKRISKWLEKRGCKIIR